MDHLIAPKLFKNKTCHLPGIGTLTVLLKSAETDYVKQIISAPQPSIKFSATQDDDTILNEFSALSKLIKNDLDAHRLVSLKGIGDLVKNDSGVISFIPIQLPKYFAPAIDAKQLLSDDEQNALTLVDQKLARAENPKVLVESKVRKNRWWVWAIALGLAGAGVLGYYISKYGFNSLGNVRF